MLTTVAIRQHRMSSDAADALPSLYLASGSDSISSGITVYAEVPTGGRWPAVQTLLTARWQQSPQTVEELVRIAVGALRKVQAQNGWGEE